MCSLSTRQLFSDSIFRRRSARRSTRWHQRTSRARRTLDLCRCSLVLSCSMWRRVGCDAAGAAGYQRRAAPPLRAPRGNHSPLSITTDCCVLNDVVRVGFAAQCNQDQPLSGQVHTMKPIIGCHSAEMPSRYRQDIVQREENHTRTRPQLHVRAFFVDSNALLQALSSGYRPPPPPRRTAARRPLDPPRPTGIDDIYMKRFHSPPPTPHCSSLLSIVYLGVWSNKEDAPSTAHHPTLFTRG